MRVIAGEAKGHILKGPPSTATRPMTDKIRQALFNMLASLGIEPERVLDLYAGTGSIGIEALSRGATWADFVDQSAAACAVVRANLTHTKYRDASHVHQLPVAAFLKRDEAPYDLIILDPPYADPEIVATLNRVAESRLIQSGTIVVVGHWPRITLPDQLGRLTRLRLRCHGDSCFSIYEAGEPLATSR
ncbi:MAG: rRNA (guanine966-N2)-methyltransferase [Thermomicrobiales bacterium]|jgi:16S rRNA (guanine966-N2)-methyltransferase|nr:rRNA (guanine966-N2)-methyltransferase [Thermomicrobiales bacterium]